MRLFGLEIRRSFDEPSNDYPYPFIDPFGASSNRAPAAAEVAVVEACAGLVSRCFSSARPSPPVEALTPSVLGLIGRRLVLRGECLFEISTTTGIVRLNIAQGHEIYGNADPMNWRYRLDMRHLPAPPALAVSLLLRLCIFWSTASMAFPGVRPSRRRR